MRGFGRIFRINPRIRRSPGQEPVLKPRCRCLIIPAPHTLWAGCGGHRRLLRDFGPETRKGRGAELFLRAPPCCRCTTSLVRLPVMNSDEVPNWS
ncbi:hypothetical protein AAFF_G00044490 [Aldrovandia affinis]|uniref:Uncharacterized protein n=1 Tax=Aldrovandia affinis TaxID=143900 RepID=A0AAD7WEZ6_9TELE|nr:hypothetical protein AAFF_G00044490 [Aldrovandia affinis]